MITQYTTSYSNPTTDIQNLVANRVGMVDSYVVMQTAENEFTALIYNNITKDCTQLKFTRTGNYGSYYTVAESDGVWEYAVINEYYVYSNDGVGKSLDLPVYKGVTSFSLCAITCVLTLAILFKGVLFKCLKK